MRRLTLLLVCFISFTLLLLKPDGYSAAAVQNSNLYPFLKNPIVTNVDVLIDVGHGGIDSGTLHENIYEKDINLQMAKLTYKVLREKGLTVLVNRIDDYALSEENGWLRARSRHLKDLAQRSHLANEIHPKAVVSLHVNWSKKSSVRGPLVLHQRSEPSKRLAECIQHSLNGMYGTATEAVPGKTYYLLKHVKAPAVIVEMGYISNPSDREQMMQSNKQKHLAEAIAQGVTAYLKQNPQAPPVPLEKKPAR